MPGASRHLLVVLALSLPACGGGDPASPDGSPGGSDATSAADAAAELVVPEIEHVGCWTIETLGAQGVDDVSFALDASDGAHLAYVDGGEAVYARAVAGGFRREVVGDADPAFDSRTDSALGPDGAAHIHYYMAVGAGPLDQLGHVYATNAGGPFVVTELASWYARTIDDVALAVDPAGTLHLAVGASDFAAGGGGSMDNELAYLECSGAACEPPRVLFTESAPIAFDDLALALGPAGRLDALWLAESTSAFLYRPDVRGAEPTQTILTGFHNSGSLGLDASGDAVVAMADNHGTAFADHLQVSTNRTGSWIVEDVPLEPVPLVIRATSVAVDPTDRIHVAVSADGLEYATDASGSWVVTRVAAAGTPPVLRVDGAGHVHIAWGTPEGARHAVCAD